MTEHVTYQRAKEMMKEEKSLFFSINRQEHLALHPRYIGNLKKGVVTMLDSLMSLYQDRFDGVPIAYNNVKLLQNQASLIAYQPYLHFDITAEFIIFKPKIGCSMKGVIQKVESGHISCLVHGVFNAWCPKQPLIDVMKDSDQMALMGCEIEFTVKKLSSNGGVLSLRGDFNKLIKKPPVSFKVDIMNTSTNTKKVFDDSDEGEDIDEGIGDMPDTPALNGSFCPDLCSTQIQTPFAPSAKSRKRKLSTQFEADMSFDTSETQVAGNDNSEGANYTSIKPKKKKKKMKHEKLKVNRTELSASMDEFVTEAKTKSLKKKKKKDKNKNQTT